jgi:GT2 family glycosyltransferase
VDNGSVDRSRELVLSFADRLPALRIVDSEVVGSGAACNAGIEAAAGRWVLFADVDDELGPGYLKAMATALGNRRFVASRLDCKSLNPAWVQASRKPAQVHGLVQGLFPYGYGATLGFHRDVYAQVGGFDESLPAGEDVDFCYRAGLAGEELAFVPDAQLRYRYRDTPLGIARQAFRYGLSGAILYQRYRPLGDVRPQFWSRLRSWLRIARLGVSVRDKAGLARLCYLGGHRLGELRGAIACRVIYW